MADMSTAKSGQVLVRTLKAGISSIFALFDAAPEWLKPKPAQADDCINIDSFQKKRTGFGPHSCDDLVHDYNAVDEINLMRSTFAAFIRYPVKADNCVV